MPFFWAAHMYVTCMYDGHGTQYMHASTMAIGHACTGIIAGVLTMATACACNIKPPKAGAREYTWWSISGA